jgi:excisionase family DNA binding protein
MGRELLQETGMNDHNQMHEIQEGIMTVHEVSRYLRLSEAKVYQMAHDSELPAIRIGKSWRFKKDLIDEWIRGKAMGNGGT